MSQAAYYVRRKLLLQQIAWAKRRASELWCASSLAFGFGSPQQAAELLGLVEEYLNRAEQLSLELGVDP